MIAEKLKITELTVTVSNGMRLGVTWGGAMAPDKTNEELLRIASKKILGYIELLSDDSRLSRSGLGFLVPVSRGEKK